jgi:hypothetical protein
MKLFSIMKLLILRKKIFPLKKQELYLSLICYKNIRKIESTKSEEDKLRMKALSIDYNNYIYVMKQLDSEKDKGINYFETKKSLAEENNYLNIRKDNIKIIKLFNIHKVKNLPTERKYRVENILEEHIKDLKSRKISSRLEEPYYFFTARYNEKSMPSQIKHWTSSAYTFFKPKKTVTTHLDLYTNKLIRLFFRVKYIKRKNIWDTKLLEGFKITPDISLINDINIIISYTSNRASQGLKILYSYPKIFLSLPWLSEQIKSSLSITKRIRDRKADFFTGFYPKKKSYLKKLSRIMLSKPFFKHTAFNLIIDLFIYNNKRFKYRMLKNIAVRRGTYKYMYSMYVDYSKKISETLNRPRFFYINLIEPKIYKYYKEITSQYGYMFISNVYPYLRYTLLLNIKDDIINTCRLYLKRNSFLNRKRNKSIELGYDDIWHNDMNEGIINNSNYNEHEDNNKEIVSFKRYSNSSINNNSGKKFIKMRSTKLFNWLFKLKKNRNINLLNLKKNVVKKLKAKSDSDDNKKDKNIIKDLNLQYRIYKKYLQELNRKSNTPIDLKSLSLWNAEGLGKNYKTPGGNKNEALGLNNRNNNKNRFRDTYVRKNILNNKEKNKYKTTANLRKAEIWDKRHKKVKEPFFDEYINFLNTKSNKSINDKRNIDVIFNDKNNISSSVHTKWLKENKKQNRIESSILNNNDYQDNTVVNNIEMITQDNNDNNVLISTGIIPNNDEKKQSFDKEDYIKDVYLNDNNNILNGLFTSFYINSTNENNENNDKDDKKDGNEDQYNNNNNNNNNSNNSNNNNTIYLEDKEYRLILNANIEKDLMIDKNKYIAKRNLTNSVKRKYYPLSNKSSKKSKELWDGLDYSIISGLFNLTTKYPIKIRNENVEYKDSIKTIYKSIKKVNKFIEYGDIWYKMYYTNYVKKEFYNISREVLASKNTDIISFTSSKINESFYYNEDDPSSFNVYYFKDKIYNLGLDIWFAFYPDKREEDINSKLGYNEKIFKPYYRYMIPLLIKKIYNKIYWSLSYWVPWCFYYEEYFFNKCNEFMLFNYVSVKILLDLLRYNYRYLIRVKPKYHFLNKLRFYETKLKKLNINNWVASIRYIKKLRKTPKNYWLRYHKVASYYFGLVIKNAEMDTERKIFVPFVLYFEDILFNIYGKWVLIRLWPLKRYYLSSFILAGRVLTLIVWRRRRKHSKFNFQRITSKLITGMRILQIQKAYDYYIVNNSRWPDILINKMSNEKYSNSLSYTDLEFYIKKEFRGHTLNSYNLFTNNSLASFLPAVLNNYGSVFDKSINAITHINKRKSLRIKRLNINKFEFIYYWLRPLKNYLLKLNRNFDISGIKLRICGRAGIRRNNLRSLYKTRFYGNLMGPFHLTEKMIKPKMITLPRLRGYLRSNIDYAFSVSKSKNGSISFKVWMSSVISTDVHELLLHLVKIKFLYSQLVNRYYAVNPLINRVKNNYLLFPLKKRFRKVKIRNRRLDNGKKKKIRC